MIKFSTYFAFGGAAGFTPRQIDEMTIWEFRCLQNGWRMANGGEQGPKAPTKGEYEAALDRMSHML